MAVCFFIAFAIFVTLIFVFLVFKSKEPFLRYKLPVAIFLFTFIGISFAYIGYVAVRFYDIKPIPEILPNNTLNGNAYSNDTSNHLMENGNRVYILICESELRKEWNSRSLIKYDSLDARKQSLRQTLIRYLSSKGFSRDSVGVSKLTYSDVKNVENGMGNYIFSEKGLYSKIYSIFWEFYIFDIHGDPSGHSVTQRILYLKTAFNVLRDNVWFGVGTGDICNAMRDQYEKEKSPLSLDFRHRAHNQFLTFAVTYGVPFALILIGMFVLVPYWEDCYTNYFFLVVFCVSMLSFLNEDTLETHPGVSFVAFFYSLFLFGIQHDKVSKSK